MSLKSNRLLFLGIPIAALTLDHTVEVIKERIVTGVFTQHVVVNAAKIVAMQDDPELKMSVLHADMISADGMSVVWASRLLGHPLPGRVAGIDLMMRLVSMAHVQGLRCYFLGAEQPVVEKVVEVFSRQYSPSVIAGFRNGFYGQEDEPALVEEIARSKADLLFVAMSSPKKEIFLERYKFCLNVSFVMGVGGSFDVVAGVTKRAPLWMQGMGMEWFFRFIQEPQRMWRRYLVGNSRFVWIIFKAWLHKQ